MNEVLFYCQQIKHTQMKKIAFSLSFILLFTSILFVSCGDDEEVYNEEVAEKYFIRFKVDGELRESKDQSFLYVYFFQFTARTTAGIIDVNLSSNESLRLNIYDIAPITTGIYSGYSVSSDGGEKGVWIVYLTSGTLYATHEGYKQSGTITITKLTSTEMAGTFSATLTLLGMRLRLLVLPKVNF